MSSTSRAWLVAASIAAVEALKDQGFCRWNYTIRTFHQHAKNRVRSSISQSHHQANSKKASSSSSSSSAMLANKVRQETSNKLKQSEESLRKVMYLSCWGPY